MHFFKYLFLFLFFFSSYSYAEISQYYLDSGENSGKTFSSKQAACNAYGTYNAVVTSDGTSCFYAQIGRYVSIKSKKLTCPSATEKNLKVPTSAGSTVCVANCSYRLTACVDVPEEPGMTCGAISTGGTCGSSSNTGVDQTTGKAPTAKDTPPITSSGANQNNDGSTATNNTANSTSTSSNTSTSTSTSTTQNNTTTTNTTTNNTTTTNTTTTIDLSSLENTINNIGKKITDAISSLKGGSDGGSDGGPDGGPDGQGSASSAIDTSGIENKLDEVKEKQDSLLDFLKGGEDGVGDNPFGSDPVPTNVLTEKTLSTNIFSSNAQCPNDISLSMPLGNRTFSHSFSFSVWCDYLAIFGSLILIFSYCLGAYIVVSKS